ncbi:hypothetical protein ACKWTF_002892 [Chironomus riparius]
MGLINNYEHLVPVEYASKFSLAAIAITCNISAFYSIYYHFQNLKHQSQMTFGMKFYWFMYYKIIPLALSVHAIGLLWILAFYNINDRNSSFLVFILVLIFDLLVVQYEYSTEFMIYIIFKTLFYYILNGIERSCNTYNVDKIIWTKNLLPLIIKSFAILIFIFISHFTFSSIYFVCFALVLCQNFIRNRFKKIYYKN